MDKLSAVAVVILMLFCGPYVSAQKLYIQMQPCECISCVKAIEMIGAYQPADNRRFIVFEERLKSDSTSLYKKYGRNITHYKIIWNDSLFGRLGKDNAIAKAVIIDEATGKIIDSRYLKQADTIPASYDTIFNKAGREPLKDPTRVVNLKYNKSSVSEFPLPRNSRFRLRPPAGAWCNLPIPGQAKISIWQEKAIIHHQIENIILVTDPRTLETDTIGLKPEDMAFYFRSLYPDHPAMTGAYINDAKANPIYRPNVVSYFTDASRIYFHIMFYFNANGNETPGSVFGYYQDGKKHYNPVSTEEFYNGQHVLGIPLFAINQDSIITNSFHIDDSIAAMRPKDKTSMLGLFVKDKAGIYQYVKPLNYYYEDVYKKIGNNLVSLIGRYPIFTYLISDKIYTIGNAGKVLKMPVSRFDFSSVQSLNDVVSGPIPYRNIDLCIDPADQAKAYLLYSVSKSANDRRVYLLYFSLNTGAAVFEKEITSMPHLDKVLSFGIDINNNRLYYVTNYGKCIGFIHFSTI